MTKWRRGLRMRASSRALFDLLAEDEQLEHAREDDLQRRPHHHERRPGLLVGPGVECVAERGGYEDHIQDRQQLAAVDVPVAGGSGLWGHHQHHQDPAHAVAPRCYLQRRVPAEHRLLQQEEAGAEEALWAAATDRTVSEAVVLLTKEAAGSGSRIIVGSDGRWPE